jgi:hypothetical protein
MREIVELAGGVGMPAEMQQITVPEVSERTRRWARSEIERLRPAAMGRAVKRLEAFPSR